MYWVSLATLRLNSTIRNSYIDLYWAFLWDLISRFSMLNYFPFPSWFGFIYSSPSFVPILRLQWLAWLCPACLSGRRLSLLMAGRTDCGLQVLEFVKLDRNLDHSLQYTTGSQRQPSRPIFLYSYKNHQFNCFFLTYIKKYFFHQSIKRDED